MFRFGINREGGGLWQKRQFMIRRGAFLLAIGAGLTVTAAFAADDTPGKAADSHRICRDSDRQLGSHIRTARRCRTAEQWRVEDEQRAQAAATLRVTEGQNDGQVGRRPQ
jgi:hypothetical protein